MPIAKAFVAVALVVAATFVSRIESVRIIGMTSLFKKNR